MARLGRPATGQTKVRHVRVPDDLWEAARTEAAAEGATVADWINADLKRRVTAAKRRRARKDQ